MDRKKLTMLAGIGGAMAALGTLLPWISISVAGIAAVSASGLKVDLGWLILVGGLAGAAVFGLEALGKGDLIKMPAKTKTLIGLIGLCVAAAITLLRFLDWPSGIGRGLGVWLCLVGGVGGAVCAFMLFTGKVDGGGGGGGDGGDGASE